MADNAFRALVRGRAGSALRSWLTLLVVLASAWSTEAAAQGARAVTLSGRVLARDGSPLAGARLQARDSDAQSEGAAAVTDAAGSYSLRLRAGREYVLSVERTGFIGGTILVEIPAGSAGLVRELRLVSASPGPTTLDSLIVRAPPRTPEPIRRGYEAGASLASRSALVSTKYPGEPGDLIASVGNSGQFVPVGRSGLSVAGQAPSANRTTLDGAGFDAESLPPEALAAAGVFTHPYDVSRGQFTGGEIAGRTMSGTNLWGGAVRASFENAHLRYGGNAGLGSSFRIGGGGGGPMVPGRLFAYIAGQLTNLGFTQRPLDAADPRLPDYGISADSARRLLQIVGGLGLGGARGGGDGNAISRAAVVRFDYLPGARHSLALRLDGRHREARGFLNSPFSASGGGSEREVSGGVLLQAVSRPGRGITHEASVYRSRSDRRSAAQHESPSGRVWLDSELADGRRGSSVLSFAGDALAWPDEDRSSLEITDRLAVPLGRGRHRVQLGGLYSREQVGRSAPTDRFGTFTFASLADLEAGRPIQYTRWLGSGAGRMSATSWAGYAGDLWTPRRDLSITYGIRAERTSYDGRRDTAADPGFGLSPVPPASGWSASPRAGFKWSRGSPVMDWVVRGGTGRFRAGAATRSLAALLAEPGMSGDVRLVCVGAAVPVPRWESYRTDPGTIPGECATNSPELSSDRPGATGFSRGYDVPAVWHSSLELNWAHRPSQISADASVSVSRGRGHPLAFDRNLVADPAFRLDAEGGRPVFVAPGAVDPASGRIVLPGSRRRAELGVVREIEASGRSAADQLALTLSRLSSMGLVQAYYTYTRTRDDASALQGPAGPQPGTGGDPRRPTRAPADFEQRHVFQLSLDRTLAPWSSLTLIGRVLSGQPFTPTVDADVNGDGFANDRAFVFGPADRELGGELAALIDGAPAGVRACLRGQAGRIAERNSCRTPWNPQLDLQLNIRPGGIRGKTAFTIVAQNTTAALDRLLHGADGLRGWGQDPYPDPVLLRVTGFDRDERRFRYQVNPSFGRDAVSRIPFTIRLQGRLTLGADPATQALAASVSNLKASMPPAEVKREILRQWANVPALVLAHAEPRRLALADSQAQRLRAAADSIAVGIATIAGALGDGPSPDENATPADLLAHAQRLLTSGFDTARAVLTREQWSRLPRLVRMPPRAVLPISAQGGIMLAPDL